jgi:hypothetical protein
MELGDDVQGGPATNEIEYEPRTLRSDVLRHARLPVAECVRIGEVLADALGYLHDQGLTHRDVKPSNIIFVGGIPKLADIGLVARSGQRTYVGTQGFTPPEGPGSPQADVYSLGMVLYELSTGKDRLDFPEVPDALPDAEREPWRKLNDVICRACEPDCARRHADGHALQADLAALAAGRRVPSSGFSRPKQALVAMAAVFFLAAMLAIRTFQGGGAATAPAGPAAATEAVPEPPATGILKLGTTPEGAEILAGSQIIGKTPHRIDSLPAGRAKFTLRLEGYRPRAVDVEILPGQTSVVAEELEFYQPPVAGKEWTNQLGMHFLPSGRNHRGDGPVTWEQFEPFSEKEGRKLPFARQPWKGPRDKTELAVMPPETAEAFCSWLLERGRRLGFLGPEHYYSHARSDVLPPRKQDDGKEWTAIVCSVRSFLYGSMVLTSQPVGAEVYELPGGRFLGRTPLELPRLVPGRQSFEFRLEGHEKQELAAVVAAEERRELSALLRPSRGVVFGKPWENSLGMKFVPVQNLMVSIWETRVADWQVFRAATGAEAARASFRQKPGEPVAGVSRIDALAFCKWLTETEQSKGFLQENHSYRLPTDKEWSHMAGIDEPQDQLPHQLDGLNKTDFPWGKQWPPPDRAGNFADEAASSVLRKGNVIAGYRDGFAHTAPVGSFPPNNRGLHDLAGNVWEWVADNYGGNPDNPASSWAVCRGGSWADARHSSLSGGIRNILKDDFKGDGLYGFRVVLERRGEDEYQAEEDAWPSMELP